MECASGGLAGVEDDTSYTLRITNSEGASFESTLHVDIHETPHFYTITATPE